MFCYNNYLHLKTFIIPWWWVLFRCRSKSKSNKLKAKWRSTWIKRQNSDQQEVMKTLGRE